MSEKNKFLEKFIIGDNDEELIKERFKSVLNLDYKNKRYLFCGSICNLHFSSEIKEIVLYNETDYPPTVIVELKNGVTIMLDKDCQIERDFLYKIEEQKEKIYCFNYDDICLGYIREI